MKGDNNGVITKIRFLCPICNYEYMEREDAEKCYAKGLHPTLDVGDFVTAYSFRFSWYDGDRNWIAATEKSDNCSSGFRHTFYYVVTYIDNDGHRSRYHLKTGAMSGAAGYSRGYTFDVHHIKPKLVIDEDVPDSIKKIAKEWIGERAPGSL